MSEDAEFQWCPGLGPMGPPRPSLPTAQMTAADLWMREPSFPKLGLHLLPGTCWDLSVIVGLEAHGAAEVELACACTCLQSCRSARSPQGPHTRQDQAREGDGRLCLFGCHGMLAAGISPGSPSQGPAPSQAGPRLSRGDQGEEASAVPWSLAALWATLCLNWEDASSAA